MEKDFDRVEIRKKSRFSFIWLIPLVAALIGCYLVYDYYMNRGLPITIIFSSGEGLEADKTVIRFEGVKVGKVTSIELIRGKKNVKVSATLDKSAVYLAWQGTIFWVVKPQLSAARISGLETMLTGVYIGTRPKKEGGDKKTDFVGLDKPPPGNPNRPGLHIVLRPQELGSLQSGSPVLYRQIEVGQVEEYELAEDNKGVDVNLYIFEEYAGLVRTTSRFWNAGGVTVTGGLSGLKVRAESLSALLAGGVAFETPAGGKPARNGQVFQLYTDYESASAPTVETFDIILHSERLGSLGAGKPVYYRSVQVGKITGYELADAADHVNIYVGIEKKYTPLIRENTRFWNVSGIGINFSILSGAKVKTESIEAILGGGVAFATPDNKKMGKPVSKGAVFKLYDEPKDKWLKWKPEIKLFEN